MHSNTATEYNGIKDVWRWLINIYNSENGNDPDDDDEEKTTAKP